MRIAICLPAAETSKSKTMARLAAMMYFTGLNAARGLRVADNIAISIVPAEGAYVHHNSNGITRSALDSGADALLWVEHDHTFPHYALPQLLADDLPFVGCTYRKRDADGGYPLMLDLVEPLAEDATTQPALAKVKFLPGGFVLIRREVYEKTAYPWYRADYGLNGRPADVFESQDVYFCENAVAAGFDIWCDVKLSTEIGHILPVEMFPEMKK
jgi:hypothetical protein